MEDAETLGDEQRRRGALQQATGDQHPRIAGSSKDELLELVFDALAARIPRLEPDPSRWREQLVSMLTAMHEVLVSHRDVALVGMGRIPTTPNALAAAEALSAAMAAGGLTPRVVALGVDTLSLYVSADAFEQGLYGLGMTETELERYFNEVHEFYEQLPPARYPTIASLAPMMTEADGDERFAFGLEVIIAGLEALSARERGVAADDQP